MLPFKGIKRKVVRHVLTTIHITFVILVIVFLPYRSEYLLNKYSELDGEILTVEIPLSQLAVDIGHAKVPQLGLCLAGNRDLNQMSVFVCGIRPGSLVDRDGRIELGDQLLEVNDQTLYGLSHLNAAPVIRSVYLEAVQGGSRAFRRSKTGSIRFVIQRYSGNISLMAATASLTNELAHSSKSSRRSSMETVLSNFSTPQKSGYDNSKAKRSIELMELAFGEKRGPLVEHTVFINLKRGSCGFGFAIMEGSPTNEKGIFVKQIIPDGPAAVDGRLCPGDQLIRVNKRDATNATYEVVLEWIRSAKQELRLQVQRWCFRSEIKAQEPRSLRSNLKRFSAPQLFGSLAAALRGDVPIIRPLSSHGQRDSLSSGKVTLEPVQENEIPRTSRPSPRKLSSRLRRASTPNLQIWPKNVEQPPSQALLSPESCLLCPSEKRGSMSTVKSVTLSVHEPQTESTEPSEPATIRSILPGEDTVIELEMEQGRGLGIGFIGGAETALNVLVVHELYANGLAVKDARLRPGDQIIRVNNAPLIGVPFLEAMNLIYSESNKAILQSTTQPDLDESPDNPKNEEGIPLGKPVLQLEVRRPKTNQSKWYDQEVTVELSKKSGKGLGICIADRCVYSSEPTAPAANGLIGSNGTSGNATSVHKNPSYGVIITDLIRGSMAATDGHLAVNDQIISVNGEDTRLSNSEVVGALLKAASNKVTIKVGRLKNQVNVSGVAFHGYLPSS
ncbi:Multiple PDZ domain protein [Fasciolopsis buskii]|uniref:Multiple PDZ domain protein n=1 Tax=Fasciolopsis buskii TaxID=27845 RepID=A0A8E0S2B2_9TREM|nr:Multiple PDZ domain protein [Fasciolopsis buski]